MRFVSNSAFGGLELCACYNSRAMAENRRYEHLSTRHRVLIYAKHAHVPMVQYLKTRQLSLEKAKVSAVHPCAPRDITASAASGSQRWTSSLRESKIETVAFVNALNRLAAHRNPVVCLTTVSPLSLNYTVHFVVGLKKKQAYRRKPMYFTAGKTAVGSLPQSRS